LLRRSFSTSPASRYAASVAATGEHSSGSLPAAESLNADGALSWNRFLALRRTRRRFQLVASIITALGSTVTGITVLSSQDLDSIGAQLSGLDPFVVMGLATFASAAGGWLVGPFFGGSLFNIVYRRSVREITAVSLFIFLPFFSFLFFPQRGLSVFVLEIE